MDPQLQDKVRPHCTETIKADFRGVLQEAKVCFSNVGKSEQNSSLPWGMLHNYLLILRWPFSNDFLDEALSPFHN